MEDRRCPADLDYVVSAVLAKFVSLRGWGLAGALAALGLVSYFLISLVLQLLTWAVQALMWLQPLVSIVGAISVIGIALLARQEARTWRMPDWRSTSR
jgi:uncharacterized membrane protein YpjA